MIKGNPIVVAEVWVWLGGLILMILGSIFYLYDLKYLNSIFGAVKMYTLNVDCEVMCDLD